ncbi:hypothetical protein [Pedobacter sp. JCM 36344]|uniref:hypothetical protein n=1 Tax=Pedobacter sp. JCM 36344 TaxID=3374280 RepID=UPI00397C4A96
MDQCSRVKQVAIATNHFFEQEIQRFLRTWLLEHGDQTLLRFDQTLEEYLANDALRDFFLNTQHPVQKLLENLRVAGHLARDVKDVYFDPINGDPLLAPSEQRIYNLGRRMDSEEMHVPFRSVQPNKQTEAGDTADKNTYPIDSEELRYNSGNHFTSMPANGSVFDENSRRCIAKSEGNLHVFFKRGFLEERLQEIKEITASMHQSGVVKLQFFVVCSRHSIMEGHYGTSLVIMDPVNPDFPTRVMVCDTLLKALPHHPRWWNHFITEYSNVFGNAIAEIVEDLSHPLQKVNVKGDDPYRHDWDCPYYSASTADAFAELVKSDPELMISGPLQEIHEAMKDKMPDYYQQNGEIKERFEIQTVNRLKRWNSGGQMINNLVKELGSCSLRLFD